MQTHPTLFRFMLLALGASSASAACGSEGLLQADVFLPDGSPPIDPASDRRDASTGCTTFRVSFEGASDVLRAPNTLLGSLSVRLRDAFARWDPFSFAGIQVGQVKAPFQEEELRGTQALLFASRAVGVERVAPGRGAPTKARVYGASRGQFSEMPMGPSARYTATMTASITPATSA